MILNFLRILPFNFVRWYVQNIFSVKIEIHKIDSGSQSHDQELQKSQRCKNL
jgi:hypothetical protein